MVVYSPPSSDPEQDQVLVLQQTQSWVKRALRLMASLVLLILVLVVVFVVWTWRNREAVQTGGQTELLQTDDPVSALRRISSRARTAIHLEGSLEEEVPGLQWSSGQGQGFSQGNVRLQRNQITVLHSGLYFIYSQASFRTSCLPHLPPEPQPPLSHRVWRFSESVGSEVSIMSAVRTVCSDSGQEERGEAPEEAREEARGWYSALYLGAVVQLHTGDRLWTETNHLQELETEEGRTFFGLFALF
ncbi:unnamed protein product [Knipowitschia caucasica]|uniref:Tumor necrosis factor n=1 Tax=Knipowitschia caucasica TaxID=637954 RepID=A0AAV2ME87_KNICA